MMQYVLSGRSTTHEGTWNMTLKQPGKRTIVLRREEQKQYAEVRSFYGRRTSASARAFLRPARDTG